MSKENIEIKEKYTEEEKEKRKKETTKKAQRDIARDYYPYIIIIIFIVIIRLWIATPVQVSGTSMYPTLENKDIMLLYKLRPKTKGINRFDIVVINTDSGRLIKRVIGLPGDKISYKIEDEKGILYINGKKVKEKFIDEEAKMITCDVDVDICGEEVLVEKDTYYVMGDNRGNSKDSRMIGAIEKDQIEGITSLILFPFNRAGKVK